MIETLIIPGLNGSPAGHWQHHWSETDDSADTVEQEDWAEPNLLHWRDALEARIAATSVGVILIAHSLGCSLVASLAKRPAAAHVGGALLVAPVDTQALAVSYPAVGSFVGSDRATLPFASIVAASRNDPYLSLASARRLSEIWGSAFHDLGEAGHVNIASGYGAWPDGEVLADGLRGRVAHSAVRRGGRRLSREEILYRAAFHDTGLGVGGWVR